jgi:formate dehydrogenase maturation protein FdhE
MRAAIEASLTEWPPPTVCDLTSRFGCTEAVLKYRFPDLYSAALTRLPERKQFFNEQTIVLMHRASKEEPAPPVRTVAARTGRSAHCLRVLHANLFKTIKARHHAQRKVDAANLRTAFRTEIASAITDLLQRGIKPSRHRVFAAILHPSMRNSHIVDQQIIASLREKEASPEKFAGGKC